MSDKAIEFLSFENGNFVIRTLDIQQGLTLERKLIRPTNPVRTGAGTLIKQVLKYSKTDFSLSGTAHNRELGEYLKSLHDDNLNFTMKIYYKDGDIIDKGVRGDRAVSHETFLCTISEMEPTVNINENTYSIDVEILEL
jgi:hypothetical protein